MLVNSTRILIRPLGNASKAHVQNRFINIAGEPAKPMNYGRSQPPPLPGKMNKSSSVFAYTLGVLPVATFGLGVWQCYRLNWKLGMIERLEKMVKSDPKELPEDFDDGVEYAKYRLRGRYDLTRKPVFVFPRKPIEKDTGAGGGLISAGRNSNIGAQLILPFVISDGPHAGKRILVNVGWVSKQAMEAIQKSDYDKTPLVLQNDADIELVGVLRNPEKRQPFQQKSSGTEDFMSRRNISKMARIFSSNQFFLDGENSTELRLADEAIVPIGSQTRVTLRNEHLSYIITWFSLSGIFSYLWYSKIFRKRL